MFQLEKVVEQTVKENKELSNHINNYNSLHSKLLAKEIYDGVTSYLCDDYVKKALFSVPLFIASYLFIDFAREKQNVFLELSAIFGSAGFLSYFIINIARLNELGDNAFEIQKQSKEYAQNIIKERLGIRK